MERAPEQHAAEPEQHDDPVFQQEQAHLSTTYATLTNMASGLIAKMSKNSEEAAADKLAMLDDVSPNFASYADAMETYADFATINRVIDAYNISQSVDAEKLNNIRLLLRQPYFAKVVLQFKPGDEPKEIYLGAAGVSDDDRRRLVVDWRSPVAEVYYNQASGPTSYEANGRTIKVDLKLRRQFDIAGSQLNAYFDTTVAIQDELLLASLSKQRSARMQAITATIQKEQNQVIRHEDVPALLVAGIAGSGKTSVLLQRIAYLLFQQRDKLDPSEVFLITPNPVFARYIDNVLPDMGERNPESLTWGDFLQQLMPPERTGGTVNVPVELLDRIDRACERLTFEDQDYRDVQACGERLISAAQIRQVRAKFKNIQPGPHLVTLMREELHKRLTNRLAQKAAAESTLDELAALSFAEQLQLFGETFDATDEDEARRFALAYVNDRYADARAAVENDSWLRIDRIGQRLLGEENLPPVAWLYLKMALTGLGNPAAKLVIIDEVQDYSAAQLMVLARYFRRAHLMLLGDENQAINPGTATFAQVRDVLLRMRGAVDECRLMTSYRSTPQITALFAQLMDEREQMQVQSVQRDCVPPRVIECASREERIEQLRRVLEQAREGSSEGADAGAGSGKDAGLTAVIVPNGHVAKQLQKELGESAPSLVDAQGELPAEGTVLITLKLAKGLEFDHVIIPEASERTFPDDPLSRRRLYTTISRATKKVTLLTEGKVTPLLQI